MRKIISIKILIILSLVYQSCSSGKKSTSGFYNYEVECMGTEMDGTQMVKAYGKGKTKNDAIAQAKKIAIEAVIFKGVRLGQGCLQQPLVANQNARNKNQAYFNKFFTDKSTYETFISMGDSPERYIEVKKETSREKVYAVTMTVKMNQLKDELVKKGLIEKDIQ